MRLARRLDAELFALSLQPSQTAQMLAETGLRAVDSLTHGVVCSDRSWCVAIAGKPAMLLGVMSAPSAGFKTGVPWLAINELAAARPRVVVEVSRWVVPEMLKDFDALAFFVDSANRTRIRYAHWLGFVPVRERPNLRKTEFMLLRPDLVEQLLKEGSNG